MYSKQLKSRLGLLHSLLATFPFNLLSSPTESLQSAKWLLELAVCFAFFSGVIELQLHIQRVFFAGASNGLAGGTMLAIFHP